MMHLNQFARNSAERSERRKLHRRSPFRASCASSRPSLFGLIHSDSLRSGAIYSDSLTFVPSSSPVSDLRPTISPRLSPLHHRSRDCGTKPRVTPIRCDPLRFTWIHPTSPCLPNPASPRNPNALPCCPHCTMDRGGGARDKLAVGAFRASLAKPRLTLIDSDSP
jgi:hypothetical protein